MRIVRWFNKSLDLRNLAEELAEFVCLELEFAREADSTERVRRAFSGTTTVRIPRVRWLEQVSETELIYYVADTPDAAPHRHVQAFDMRWDLHAELTHLLARCGLRVDATFGDFDRSPLVDASPEQIVLAST